MHSVLRKRITWIICAAVLVAAMAAASPAFAQEEPDITIVYRFYNQGTGSHFYTASAAERDHVIATWPSVFTYEGPAFTVYPAGWFNEEIDGALTPVYRFFNKTIGSHFYTISAAEADSVKAKYPAVFNYDGIGFEAYAYSPVDWSPLAPVYRFYNKTNGAHFFTISEVEKAVLLIQYRDVYRYEGVGFYAVPFDRYYLG